MGNELGYVEVASSNLATHSFMFMSHCDLFSVQSFVKRVQENLESPQFIIKMNQLIDETIGWIGTVLILTSYTLVSFGILTPTNIINYLMNIIGSIGILYISFKKGAYQPGVLNIVWAAIALIGLIGLVI